MVCHHTKFYVSSCNSSLIITSKDRAKYRSHLTNLLFHNTQTKNVHKLAYSSKIYRHTKFLGPTLKDMIFAPTSEICATAILVLLMVGN